VSIQFSAASSWRRMKRRVLLIDLDPQGNANDRSGWKQRKDIYKKTLSVFYGWVL